MAPCEEDKLHARETTQAIQKKNDGVLARKYLTTAHSTRRAGRLGRFRNGEQPPFKET